MRPLELVVEGFTSFRTRTEVRLRDLDLFAITGPTGAGKTSLLDAMIYALYGHAPRVSKEVSQLVSRGLKHLKVQLDFAVGAATYRVVRSSSLSAKSVVTRTALEREENGGWTPVAGKGSEVEEAIEKLIGLDYESFIRSVVLPQGSFDRFLKGEPRERQKILHHLLRMGIYERVRELAEERARTHAQEAELLEIQIEDLAGATPEALAGSRAALAGLEAETGAIAGATRRVEAEKERAGALVRALADAAAAGAEAARIDAARRAAAGKVAAIAGRQAAGERALAELDRRLAANTHDEARYLALETAAVHAANLRAAEAERERVLAEMAATERASAELSTQLDQARSEAEERTARSTAAAQALAAARAVLAELARRFGSPAAVATQLANLDHWERLRAAREEKEEAAKRAGEEIAGRRQALERARGEAAEAAAARLAASAALEEVQRANAALELRTGLERGQPCPVCEQPVATVPRKRAAGDVARAREAHERAQARERETAAGAASLAARLEAEEREAKRLAGEITRLRDDEDSAAAQLEVYLGASPDAAARERLDRAQEEFERAEGAVREREREAQAAQEAVAAATGRTSKLDAALAAERAARAEREKTAKASEEQIASLRTTLAGLVGGAPDLLAAVEAALTAARRAKAERESVLRERENEVRSLGTAGVEAAVARAEIAELEKKGAETAGRLHDLTASARAERAALARAAAELEIELPESPTGEAEQAVIARRRSELAERRVELEGRRALASSQTDRLAADLEKRAGLAERHREAQRLGALARTLAGDLRANNFVAYLLEEALAVLAADASRHLDTFPGRSFSLAVEGQDFVVVDHANADERRSVRTLSGGESFNASLALAIAFAERLAELARTGGASAATLESLFLDEGFGTLDAENLDAVAGAIEALYGRGRTVGIITHIPELAGRMPTRIVVTKEGNTSRVRIESG